MSATAAPTATRPPPRQRPLTGGSSADDGAESPSSVTQTLSSFFAGVTAKPVAATQSSATPSPRNINAQPRPNNAVPVNANGPVRAPPNGSAPLNGAPMQPRPNGAAPPPQQRMQRPGSGGPQSFPPANANGAPRPAGAPIAGAAPRPQQGASALNPAVSQNRPPPQQQRLSGGPGAFPRAAPPTVPSPQPSESSADSSSASSTATTTASSSDDWKAQFERLQAESRQYKRVTQEELETMKRNRISLQNQLQESQSNAAEAIRQLAEQSSRVSELTAALTKSRAAAETELNFFNLEVEKEIARSKQDKEKARLQATLASYEDAHKKNKKIIETLNGEIVKLKQAYKAIANGNSINTTNGTSSTSTTSSASSADVAQVVELQNKLSALEASSSAELSEAKRQLEAANTQLTELKAGLAKNASTSDASAENSLLLQAQVTELKSNNSALESRVKQLNEELERRLALHESQLKEKWVQIAALQSELEKLKAVQEEALSKQQSAAKSREEALQKRVNEAESTVVAFRERNDALSKDKQALTIQLDESQTLVASLRQDLLSQSERFNKDEKALRATLAERGKQLESLRIEKDDAVKELTHQLSELANKMEGNTLQHREKVAQMDAAFNALKASTTAEIASLQAQLQKTREDAAAAEREATAKLEAAQSQIEAVERRSVDLQLQLKEKKTALNVYHEQIEYNARQREEKLRNTPAKKPSLLDSIAKKLTSIGDKEKQDEVLSVDMFNESNLPASASSSSSGFSSSRGPAGSAMSEQARNELAEEVAVSLSKRLQESENAKLALENEVRTLRRQSRPPQANSTPGRPVQARR